MTDSGTCELVSVDSTTLYTKTDIDVHLQRIISLLQ